jgi:DNA-binding NarL/FixJ family response regulator
VSALIATQPDFECIARTIEIAREIGAAPNADARRNAALLAASNIDVVLISLTDELARLNDNVIAFGIETLADVGVPVVLLVGFGDESPNDFVRGFDWIRKHVRGVVSLDSTIAELTASLVAVHSGLVVLEPRVADAIAQSLQTTRRRPASEVPASSRPAGSALPLSEREREVLALLAEGRATKNIAHQLGISSHTVKAHVESIFEKFGATTRAEAVAIGVRRGAVML